MSIIIIGPGTFSKSCILGSYTLYIHVWQSRVEIKHYSVANFDHITAFEVL